MTESTLSWLDLNEEGRQQMHEHLALLTEPGTLDELGTGQVRDVFSGLFFPGTSTLWSRARYLLFVPWVYQALERDGTGNKTGRDAARSKQTALIRALKRSSDTRGLIGKFNDELQQMPDGVVWNGLHIWGIRVHDGSMGRYQRSLQRFDRSEFKLQVGDDGEALDASSGSWWHALMPSAPHDLFDRATFELTRDEAEFLCGRLQEHHPESMLARMLVPSPLDAGDFSFPWEHSAAVGRLSASMQAAVEHARIFSGAIQGAGILYSILVSRAKRSDGKARELEERLEDWSDAMRDEGVLKEARGWGKQQDAFWELTTGLNRGINARTRGFVDEWMSFASLPAQKLAVDAEAERLIRRRERWTKGSLARLSSAKALDGARDESGTGRLEFRWTQAKRIVADIARGMT